MRPGKTIHTSLHVRDFLVKMKIYFDIFVGHDFFLFPTVNIIMKWLCWIPEGANCPMENVFQTCFQENGHISILYLKGTTLLVIQLMLVKKSKDYLRTRNFSSFFIICGIWIWTLKLCWDISFFNIVDLNVLKCNFLINFSLDLRNCFAEILVQYCSVFYL